MVWTAVLLVLVLSGGEAAGLACDEWAAKRLAAGDYPAAEWSLRGFFVDPARQTRVYLRIRNDEKLSGIRFEDCFFQHEDGPLVQARRGWEGKYIDFVAPCRDPVSGRTHVIVSRSGSGSGSISSTEYWSVHPDTEQMTREYQENPILGDTDYPELGPGPLVDAAGQCRWRQQKAARAVFDDAMVALRAGIELEDEALDIAVGESLVLPTRVLSAETVRHWLHALRPHATAFATIETIDFSESTSTPAPPWRLVQILGRELCSAPGVVLLHDTRSGKWRSLYAVPSGCSKVLNFPLRDMVLTGDTLLASACTDSHYWGAYEAFAIDLPTHRITRVEPAAD